MNEFDLLKLINISQEDLNAQVVDTIADKVINTRGWTNEDGEVDIDTQTKEQLTKLIQSTIKQHIDKVFEKVVAPKLEQLIDTCILQKTNSWGEAKGKAMTFKEYLAEYTEKYMLEPVNGDGKSKKEANDYNWREKSTRITYLVDYCLALRIHNVISTALKKFNVTLAEGLSNTVKLHLEETLNKLQVTLTI